MVFFGDVLPPFVDCLFYFCMIVVLFVVFKVLEYFSRKTYLNAGFDKYHCWRTSKFTNQVLYCSGCGSMLDDAEGLLCVYCGVAAGRDCCLKKVNKTIICKELASHLGGPMKHHWVLGNVPVGYNCYVCEEDCCSSDPGLADFRCVWCDRAVHTRCKHLLGEVCDFGPYKNFLIPPTCVQLAQGATPTKNFSSLKVEKIHNPPWRDWCPLFVLGNSQSGGQRGEEVLCLVRRWLHPLQVVDLCQGGGVALVLKLLSLLPAGARPRVLVAGGDGSIAWFLSDFDAFRQNLKNDSAKGQSLNDVAVGIVPLGTGNDLARVLGWGSQEPSRLSAEQIFSQIQSALPTPLDRWKVDIKGVGRFRRANKELFMYNYLSVGVDAMVTLKFHRTRKSPFYLFSSRIINKMLYLWFGADQVLERACSDMESKVELYLDGVRVALPALESIVILNIPSWGAGVPLWTLGRDESDSSESESRDDSSKDIPPLIQRMDDNLLEVAAIYSSFHIAQLQVGLSKPHRIGQAKHIKLKLKKRLPMQVDGEPWMQSPAEISVTFHNQAQVLKLE